MLSNDVITISDSVTAEHLEAIAFLEAVPLMNSAYEEEEAVRARLEGKYHPANFHHNRCPQTYGQMPQHYYPTILGQIP